MTYFLLPHTFASLVNYYLPVSLPDYGSELRNCPTICRGALFSALISLNDSSLRLTPTSELRHDMHMQGRVMVVWFFDGKEGGGDEKKRTDM